MVIGVRAAMAGKSLRLLLCAMATVLVTFKSTVWSVWWYYHWYSWYLLCGTVLKKQLSISRVCGMIPH